MAEKLITDLVNELPSGGLTVNVLRGLDFVAPGQWNNLTDFDEMIRTVTGESDGDLIEQVRDRALELYQDESEGYQRAIWMYQTVDSAASALGTAAMANKIGQDTFLSFLSSITRRI